MSRLRSASLFSGLSDAESQEILLSGRVRSYFPDEVIFSQGHPANAMLLIECGSVKLTQVSPEGNEVILWMSGFGESIGMQAEDPTGSYSCTARVVERCRAVVWDHARLSGLLGKHHRLGRNLNQILTQRLQELEIRFREVATERVANRLAMTLLRLQHRIGKPCEGGIEIALSREELAQMTGTTLFTISRLLSKWGDEGLITPRREAVIVRDAKGLERIGESGF
ncbi:Crp/Fnr family transcriptional regulator [Occallatibacter savannae]|uniref:Crp/Fnr family transcriptional regulator n=1 Tax=Occallatibacter savannae TaxID=1002691 RepID=UPI0013A5B14E|nr:Crp/Fnr family transcriptional regulator [Occallatibacter savannae]